MGWQTKVLLSFLLAVAIIHVSQASKCSRNQVQFRCKCISKHRLVGKVKRRIAEVRRVKSRQTHLLKATQRSIKSTRGKFVKIPRSVVRYMATLRRRRNAQRRNIILLQRKRRRCHRLKRLIGSYKTVYKRILKIRRRYRLQIKGIRTKLRRMRKSYLDRRLLRTRRCRKHIAFLSRRRRRWQRGIRRLHHRLKRMATLRRKYHIKMIRLKALYKRDCSRPFHRLLQKYRRNYRAHVRLFAKKRKRFLRDRRRNRFLRRRIRQLRARRFRLIAAIRYNAYKLLVFMRVVCIFDKRNKSKRCRKIRKRNLKRAHKRWKRERRKARKATRSIYRTIRIKLMQLKITKRRYNRCKRRRSWRHRRCIRLRRLLRRLRRRIQAHLRRRRRRAFRRYHRLRKLYRFCRRVAHRKRHYKQCRNIYKRYVRSLRVIRRYRRQRRKQFHRRFQQMRRRYYRCLRHHKRRPKRCWRQRRAYFHLRTILQNRRRHARYHKNRRYYRKVFRAFMICRRKHPRHYRRFCRRNIVIIKHLRNYFRVHYVVTLRKAKHRLYNLLRRSRRCRHKSRRFRRGCNALRLQVMNVRTNVQLLSLILMSMSYRRKMSLLRHCGRKRSRRCRILRIQTRRLGLRLRRGRHSLYHRRRTLYMVYMRLFKRCVKRNRRRVHRCRRFLRKALHLQRRLRAYRRGKRRSFAIQIKRKRIIHRRLSLSYRRCRRVLKSRKCKALGRRLRVITRQLVRLTRRQFVSRIRLFRVVKGRMRRLCGKHRRHHRRRCTMLRRQRRAIILFLVAHLHRMRYRDARLLAGVRKLYRLCRRRRRKHCRYFKNKLGKAKKRLNHYAKRRRYNALRIQFLRCGSKHGKLSKKCSRVRGRVFKLLKFFHDEEHRKFLKLRRLRRSLRKGFRNCRRRFGKSSKVCLGSLHRLLILRLYMKRRERHAIGK